MMPKTKAPTSPKKKKQLLLIALVIAAAVVLIAAGAFLFPRPAPGGSGAAQSPSTDGQQPNILQQRIEYQPASATKTIEFWGNKRIETISLKNAERFAIVSVIPKSLQENASELRIEHNAEMEIWKEDPVLLFRPKESTITIKTTYGNSTTGTVNLILPLEAVHPISETDRETLLAELDAIAEMDLNIEKANILENMLGQGIVEGLSKAGVAETAGRAEGSGTAYLADAETGLESGLNIIIRIIQNINKAIKEEGQKAKLQITANPNPYVLDRHEEPITITIGGLQSETIYYFKIIKDKEEIYSMPVYLTTRGQTKKIEWTPPQKVATYKLQLIDNKKQLTEWPTAIDVIDIHTAKEHERNLLLNQYPWPEETREVGLTINKPSATLEYALVNPARQAGGMGIYDTPFDAINQDKIRINGIEQDALRGSEISAELEDPEGDRSEYGKSAYSLLIKVDYKDFLKGRPELPQTIEKEIRIDYGLLGSLSPPIKLKIKLNEPGAILYCKNCAKEGYDEAGLTVTEVAFRKGWDIIAVDKSARARPVDIKAKITEKYNEAAFKFLLILGGDSEIALLDRKGLLTSVKTKEAAKTAGVEDSAYHGEYKEQVLDSAYYGNVDSDPYVELMVGRLPDSSADFLKKYFTKYFETFETTMEEEKAAELPSYSTIMSDTTGGKDVVVQRKNFVYSGITPWYIFVSDFKDEEGKPHTTINDVASLLWAHHSENLLELNAELTNVEHAHDTSSHPVTVKYTERYRKEGDRRQMIISHGSYTARELGPEFLANGALNYIGYYQSGMESRQGRSLHFFSTKELDEEDKYAGSIIKNYLNAYAIPRKLNDAPSLERGFYEILLGDPSNMAQLPKRDAEKMMQLTGVEEYGISVKMPKLSLNDLFHSTGFSDREAQAIKNGKLIHKSAAELRATAGSTDCPIIKEPQSLSDFGDYNISIYLESDNEGAEKIRLASFRAIDSEYKIPPIKVPDEDEFNIAGYKWLSVYLEDSSDIRLTRLRPAKIYEIQLQYEESLGDKILKETEESGRWRHPYAKKMESASENTYAIIDRPTNPYTLRVSFDGAALGEGEMKKEGMNYDYYEVVLISKSEAAEPLVLGKAHQGGTYEYDLLSLMNLQYSTVEAADATVDKFDAVQISRRSYSGKEVLEGIPIYEISIASGNFPELCSSTAVDTLHIAELGVKGIKLTQYSSAPQYLSIEFTIEREPFGYKDVSLLETGQELADAYPKSSSFAVANSGWKIRQGITLDPECIEVSWNFIINWERVFFDNGRAIIPMGNSGALGQKLEEYSKEDNRPKKIEIKCPKGTINLTGEAKSAFLDSKTLALSIRPNLELAEKLFKEGAGNAQCTLEISFEPSFKAWLPSKEISIAAAGKGGKLARRFEIKYMDKPEKYDGVRLLLFGGENTFISDRIKLSQSTSGSASWDSLNVGKFVGKPIDFLVVDFIPSTQPAQSETFTFEEINVSIAGCEDIIPWWEKSDFCFIKSVEAVKASD